MVHVVNASCHVLCRLSRECFQRLHPAYSSKRVLLGSHAGVQSASRFQPIGTLYLPVEAVLPPSQRPERIPAIAITASSKHPTQVAWM